MTGKREAALLDLHIHKTSMRLNIALKLKELGVCSMGLCRPEYQAGIKVMEGETLEDTG